MARTVDSPLALGPEQAFARAEILDTNADGGGIASVFRGVNTLYEQKRGSLVCDWQYSPPIIDALGEVARYRGRVQGGGALTDESVEVQLYVALTAGAFLPRNATIAVRETVSGNSISQTFSAGTGWVTFTNLLDIADDVEFVEFEIEITAVSNLTAYKVIGVAIYYARDKATLAAGVYDQGFVPLEISQADGEKPLSVARLADLHRDLLILYETRLSQIVSYFVYGGNNPALFFVPVPQNNAGEITLRIYLYCAIGALASTLAVSCAEDSDGGALAGGWNGPYDLVVASPESDKDQPKLVIVTCEVATGDGSIVGASGWVVDGSY